MFFFSWPCILWGLPTTVIHIFTVLVSREWNQCSKLATSQSNYPPENVKLLPISIFWEYCYIPFKGKRRMGTVGSNFPPSHWFFLRWNVKSRQGRFWPQNPNQNIKSFPTNPYLLHESFSTIITIYYGPDLWPLLLRYWSFHVKNRGSSESSWHSDVDLGARIDRRVTLNFIEEKISVP